MDPVALTIILGGVGFAVVLGLGLWLLHRRTKRREAAARASDTVQAPISAPIFNRRSLAWAGVMFAFAFAMGALTSKGGPIPQSSAWAGADVGLVFVVGISGFLREALRRIGDISLDRPQNTLTVRVGDQKRVFYLNESFDYDEFLVPPGGLYTFGGTGIILKQGPTTGSFWYMNDARTLKASQGLQMGVPPENLKTNELGRVIRDHLRAIAAERLEPSYPT
jgi:hypothetical protein